MAPRIPITVAKATTNAMLAAYVRRAEDWRRDHLGASILGHQCDRFLWLSFRWVMPPNHDGQQLRLFERGKRAESWLIEDLRAAGVTVWEHDGETGEQASVKWGHIGGSLDGVASGLPEWPDVPHVLECKTHGSNSFKRLLEKGVKNAKPEHYAQTQVYMLGTGLDAALYLAVCKNNDELYAERIKFDRVAAEGFVARGQAIVAADQPAPPLDKDFPPCIYVSRDGTRWPCSYYDQCHDDKVVPEKNCRTCLSSTAEPDGAWSCMLHGALDTEKQRKGCGEHLTVPVLFNAQVMKVEGRSIDYQFADGRTMTDGVG